MSDVIRIGVIGAGENTRNRHLPGFRSLQDVEIRGVVNSTKESTQRVASEFDIPETFETWQELVASDDIDAIVIGTWPNLHSEITCAALAAGKHVLCEARMARDLTESRKMLAAAKEHPELVAQLVPSPFGLECGPTITDMLKSFFLGDLREVIVLGANDQFWDYSKTLHPRQDFEQNGKNTLALGILHETLMRWAPKPVQVFSQSEIFEPTRPVPQANDFVEVKIPDSVQIVSELKGGVRCMYHLSGVILFGPGLQIHLYGSRGTIKIEFNDGNEKVWYGRADDKEMSILEIPEEEKGSWNVEADFIESIRGNKKVSLTDFKTGVEYMEFVEAVALSASSNQPVSLPLED